MADGDRPIMIKKVKKVIGGGHHGGAWKVAYADFVTAMMAFFLLMWLINTTSPEQKVGIAGYFAPASVSQSTSGAGGILGGNSLSNDDSRSGGSKDVLDRLVPQAPASDVVGSSTNTTTSTYKEDTDRLRREERSMEMAAQSLRQAMQSLPELSELSKQVLIDKTPEGLRIQLVDQEGRPMFDGGSTKPNARARVLLKAVTKILNQLPNRVSIAGHTSAEPGNIKTANDWGLSSSRADAARAMLEQSGLSRERIYQVAGKASVEPLFPDDPTLPSNRRITITLLREAPVLPADKTF
jgi:chemotaxis protein MotB